MVSSMDDGIGLILDKLEEKNISDNTIVVFFSDNGGVEWYNFSDNGFLRGIKEIFLKEVSEFLSQCNGQIKSKQV